MQTSYKSNHYKYQEELEYNLENFMESVFPFDPRVYIFSDDYKYILTGSYNNM